MNKRRRYYIDRLVQGKLLGLLLLFEALLFIATMGVVYLELQGADTLVPAVTRAPGSGAVLVNVLLRILPWVLLANLVMVLVIGGIWGGYVKSIVNPLKKLLSSVEKLDLRGNGRIDSRHEALDIGRRWILKERERNLEIRACISAMSEDIDVTDHQFRGKLRHLLAEIKGLLPIAR